jgi:hypothetical protein
MLTNEERLIYDMLASKIGTVPSISIENKRETKKEMQQRIIKEAIKHKALRSTKKNLQK